MGRTTGGSISHIEQLLDNAKHEEALSILEKFQSESQLTKVEKYTTNILKVRIFLAMRKYEEALPAAKKPEPRRDLSPGP